MNVMFNYLPLILDVYVHLFYPSFLHTFDDQLLFLDLYIEHYKWFFIKMKLWNINDSYSCTSCSMNCCRNGILCCRLLMWRVCIATIGLPSSSSFSHKYKICLLKQKLITNLPIQLYEVFFQEASNIDVSRVVYHRIEQFYFNYLN
jgi:hypothetical protein